MMYNRNTVTLFVSSYLRWVTVANAISGRSFMVMVRSGPSREVTGAAAGRREPDPGHRQDDGEDCEHAERHQGLGAKPEPGEADHDATSNPGLRARAAAPGWLM